MHLHRPALETRPARTRSIPEVAYQQHAFPHFELFPQTSLPTFPTEFSSPPIGCLLFSRDQRGPHSDLESCFELRSIRSDQSEPLETSFVVLRIADRFLSSLLPKDVLSFAFTVATLIAATTTCSAKRSSQKRGNLDATVVVGIKQPGSPAVPRRRSVETALDRQNSQTHMHKSSVAAFCLRCEADRYRAGWPPRRNHSNDCPSGFWRFFNGSAASFCRITELSSVERSIFSTRTSVG